MTNAVSCFHQHNKLQYVESAILHNTNIDSKQSKSNTDNGIQLTIILSFNTFRRKLILDEFLSIYIQSPQSRPNKLQERFDQIDTRLSKAFPFQMLIKKDQLKDGDNNSLRSLIKMLFARDSSVHLRQQYGNGMGISKVSQLFLCYIRFDSHDSLTCLDCSM